MHGQFCLVLRRPVHTVSVLWKWNIAEAVVFSEGHYPWLKKSFRTKSVKKVETIVLDMLEYIFE